MKIGILGTGMVGRAHATKLISLGHDVMLGTRDVEKTLSKAVPDQGKFSFYEWHTNNPQVKIGTFVEVASHADIVFDTLRGDIVIDVLKNLQSTLEGKILIDVANPLDFSHGMPPTLFFCNTDSLGEHVQNTLPKTYVVKTFNTMNAEIQINPKKINGGDHDIFVSGNDKKAKQTVISLLKEYGWKNIIDLGDIQTARSTEMLLPVWLALGSVLNTNYFNFKIVK